MIIPERLIDELVVEQYPYRTGELVPQQLVKNITRVQIREFFSESGRTLSVRVNVPDRKFRSRMRR